MRNDLRRIALIALAVAMAAVAGCATVPRYTLGEEAVKNQNYDEALDHFKAGAEQYPKGSFNLEIGKIYLELRQYDRAINHFQKQVEIAPTFFNYSWLGSAYYRNGDYDKALAAYTAFKEQLDPDQEAVLYQSLTDIHLNLGQLDKAAGSAQRLVALKPVADSYNRLSNILNRAGRYDEAIAACNKAIEAEPGNAIAYSNMGWAYNKKRMFPQAIKLYNKSLEFSPNNAVTYINLAEAYYGAGRVTKAVEFAGLAARTDPGYRFNLANYQYLAGLHDLAIGICNDLITGSTFEGGIGIRTAKFKGERYCRISGVNPGLPAQRAGLMVADKIIGIDGVPVENEAVTALSSRLRGKAGSIVKIEIERESENGTRERMEKAIPREFFFADKKLVSAAYGLKSAALMRKNEEVQARRDAAKAAEIAPDGFWSHFSTGLSAMADNNFDAAARSYSACVAENKESRIPRILMALSYTRLGKFPESVAAYRELPVDEIPDDAVTIRHYLDLLNEASRPHLASLKSKADDAAAKGNYREALAFLAQAYELPCDERERSVVRSGMFALLGKAQDISMPDEVRKRDVRANLLMQEKDYRGALAEYGKALKVAPWLPGLYYNSAVILSELRDYRRAIVNMRIYLATLPMGEAKERVEDDITKWELMMEKEALK